MKTNRIGLDAAKAKVLGDKLNKLLSNLQLLYINTRGFHWNIKGDNFFELHLKFEEVYTDLQLKIDEVAERILTLGHVPDHSYTAYLKNARIEEVKNLSNGKEALKSVMDGLGILIELEREILQLSAEANDEGTNALMSDYIRQQEKLVWMYCSYLSK
ncbi:MAG: DNA starvation/stationary phase protection protein [Chitinophagaceae bacterium]|nr:DNA starvation/stationary phase protection protein [Chitinophagaceae bacterium]